MSTKLKCILLDDELPGLTYLKMLCEQFQDLEIVKAYNNPEIFLRDLPDLDFDLCILDIEMPKLSGLQVAGLLNGKSVIFTTAYKEFAIQAFDLDAVDYVSKPIQKERLQKAVQKAFQRHNKVHTQKLFVQLNTDKGKALLYFEQLQYIKNSEIDSRDKVAFLNDGTSLTLKNISFEKLDEILPPAEFCRINKKEIISIKAIRLTSFDEITTTISDKSGEILKLTLSEVYRNAFNSKIKA